MQGAESQRDFVIPTHGGDPVMVRGGSLGSALAAFAAAHGGRLDNLNFNGMDLSFLHVSDCVMTGCSFDGATAAEISFDRVGFALCSFVNAAFAGPRFHKARLDGCSLKSADFREGRWNDTEMFECSLAQARLDGSEFRHVTLADVDAQGASFRGSGWVNGKLFRSKLAGGDLSTSEFSGSDDCLMVGCDLKGSVWRSASLRLSPDSAANEAEGADFRGAKLASVPGDLPLLLGLVFPGALRLGPATKLPFSLPLWVMAYPRATGSLLVAALAVAAMA